MRPLLLVLALVAGASVAEGQPRATTRGYLVVDGDTVRGAVGLGIESENAPGVWFQDSSEVGGGISRGAFQRYNTPSFPSGYRDPSQTSVQVRAAVLVGSLWLPTAVSMVAEAAYDHEVLALARSRSFGTFAEDRLSTLSGGLGGRVTFDLAGTKVHAGVGVFTGIVLERTVQPEVDATAIDGLLRFIRGRDFRSSGGQYLEAGVRPLGGRIGLAARVQATAFDDGRFFLPFAPRGSQYGLRSVPIGASARF